MKNIIIGFLVLWCIFVAFLIGVATAFAYPQECYDLFINKSYHCKIIKLQKENSMIVVKEKKSVPHAYVRCGNCGSLLQYGNADLHEDYHRDSANYTILYGAGHYYYFNCPVCGCKVNANWIIKKEEEV